MGMGLISVVMAGRDPLQVRLSDVRRHPSHDGLNIGLEIEPLPVLGRDYEAEMMPVLAPALSLDLRPDALPYLVEEGRPLAVGAGAGPTEIDHMLGQGRRPIGALADVPRD